MISQVPSTPAFHTRLQWNGIDEDDPYLWLEDSTAPMVQNWVKDQADYTRNTIQAMPAYKSVKSRFDGLIHGNIPRGIESGGGVTVYHKTGPGDKQPRIFVRDMSGQERQLIDPNQWDKDGRTSVDWYSLSPNGQYLAYATSTGGQEDTTLSILDVSSGTMLPDKIQNKANPHRTPAFGLVGPENTLTWAPDAKSFYYASYDSNAYLQHTLGTDAQTDVTIAPQTMGGDESASVDNHYLAFSTYVDWGTENLNVYDTKAKSLTTLDTNPNTKYVPKLFGGMLYMATNDGAGNSRLVKVDPAHPQRDNWTEVLPPVLPGNPHFPPPAGAPDRGALLQDFTVAGDKIYAVYLHNAVDRLVRYNLDGTFDKEIPLPSLGTVSSLSTSADGRSVSYQYSSLSLPNSTYKLCGDEETPKLVHRDEWPGYNPDDYVVEQKWAPSKDGTLLPVLLLHAKNWTPGPDTPMVENAYGGFDVNFTSEFSCAQIPLLEHGGAFALATIRGGGEFGEDWHQAGTLQNKQNVFDDFIGVAKYLIDQKYTSADHLGITGGSNGGLLMGAAVTQAPQLFKAVDIHVPLLDMERFDQMMSDSYVNEYGTTQNPAQAGYLQKYSPYQNIQDGVAYPAVLVESGTNDPRVGPAHARKFVARMQAATSGQAPIMLREDADTGHGVGTPMDKEIDELTASWTMLLSNIAYAAKAA